MEITHKIKMDLSQQSIPPRIGVVQGDAFTRRLAIALFADKRPWKVPADATVIVRYRKPSGASGAYDTLPDGKNAVSVFGNCVSILVAPEVLSQAGNVSLMVTILSGTRQLSTFAVDLAVQAMFAADRSAEGTAWIAAFLPAPEEAAVGQYFAVETVDEHGRVLSLKAVDAPTGSAEEIRAAVAEYLADFDFSSGTGAISVTHEWNGTVLTITSASGTSSADLKGEKGEKGDIGPQGKAGADGKSAYIYAQEGGFQGSEADFSRKMAAEYVKTVNGSAPDENGNVVVEAALPKTGEALMLPEQTFPFANAANGSLCSLSPAPFLPAGGAVYKIFYDGTEFTCTATNDAFEDLVLLGNPSLVGMADTGEPFLFICKPDGSQMDILPADTDLTHDIAVYYVGTVPDLPVVTTHDNGKFLQVSDGAWAAVNADIPTAETIHSLIDGKLGVIENGTY